MITKNDSEDVGRMDYINLVFLDKIYAKADSLHLNQVAYSKRLDLSLLELLDLYFFK